MTHAGRLLVATPALTDPNFARTVILLIAHQEDGALGVVLNRASDVPVWGVLPEWAALAGEPQSVFTGGPVAPEAAICLARVRRGAFPDGWAPIDDGRIGTVDMTAPPEALEPHMERLRVFAGYAGWGAEQLEAEIAEGAWFVLEALPGDPFVEEPEALWPAVLRRQGGMLAAVATYPLDPSLN
ncbi:MAG: YqgE/AlgH family protein [Pseudonocardiales bacterium]